MAKIKLTTGIALRIVSGEVTWQESVMLRPGMIENSRRRVEEIVADHQSMFTASIPGLARYVQLSFLKRIPKKLQYNILKSHSVGVGDPISPDIAKLMMILKVHASLDGLFGYRDDYSGANNLAYQ